MGSQRKSQKVTRQYGQLRLRWNRTETDEVHILWAIYFWGEKWDLNNTKALSYTISHLTTSPPTYNFTDEATDSEKLWLIQVLTAKGLSLDLKPYPLLPDPIPFPFTKRPHADAPDLTARAKEKCRSKATPLPPPGGLLHKELSVTTSAAGWVSPHRRTIIPTALYWARPGNPTLLKYPNQNTALHGASGRRPLVLPRG